MDLTDTPFEDPSTSGESLSNLNLKRPLKKQSQSSILDSYGFTCNKPKQLPKEWKNVVHNMRLPSFVEEYKKVSLRSFDKTAIEINKKGQPVRNQEARKKFLHGYACECCASYYDALGLSDDEKKKRINQISRHRGFEPTPRTPEKYWDVEFPQRQTQKDYIVTNSPLFKEKDKVFENTINWSAISKHAKKSKK